jgi:hypothetical protein
MSLMRIIQLAYPDEIETLVVEKVVSANKLNPASDNSAYPPIYLSTSDVFRPGETIILPSYP